MNGFWQAFLFHFVLLSSIVIGLTCITALMYFSMPIIEAACVYVWDRLSDWMRIALIIIGSITVLSLLGAWAGNRDGYP